jgi:Aminoglycoside/hydroxyurea antibiotic resistance kinase
MLDQVPRAVPMLRDPAEQRLVRSCASVVTESISEPGDRLLHRDLHYDNIPAGRRQPWLAIDPKPLAVGDPSFELQPALDNRWEDVVATGNVIRAVLRRFDLLTEVLGLDRQTSDWLDARPRATERIVGHRGWRHCARPDPNRHRHGPGGSCTISPIAHMTTVVMSRTPSPTRWTQPG